MAAPTFKRLRLAGWRQFSHVDIELHDRLTVITGTNGAGKSTILNILSAHLGVSRPYLGVPQRGAAGSGFLSGVVALGKSLADLFRRSETGNQIEVGTVEYENGVKSSLRVPVSGSLQYGIEINNQQLVVGFHMPSHRLMPNYQQVPHLPFGGVDPRSAFNLMIGEAYAGFYNHHTGSSVLFQLKQVLAAWATNGEGNSIIEASEPQNQAYEGFVQILKKILPKEIGFRGIRIQPPEILLQTDSGSFLIDAGSGGLITLIEIAAMIYTCSLRQEVEGARFVVTFDEPENHLHPALQRTLLPTLIDAFPMVQFIVATHSPFMVSSRRDSNVYVLRYGVSDEISSDPQYASRRVESVKLDYTNRAGTAGEMLREVLGVPVTVPIWVETELKLIVDRYRHAVVNEDMIQSLKADVAEAGLDDMFSDALSMIGARH